MTFHHPQIPANNCHNCPKAPPKPCHSCPKLPESQKISPKNSLMNITPQAQFMNIIPSSLCFLSRPRHLPSRDTHARGGIPGGGAPKRRRPLVVWVSRGSSKGSGLRISFKPSPPLDPCQWYSMHSSIKVWTFLWGYFLHLRRCALELAWHRSPPGAT